MKNATNYVAILSFLLSFLHDKIILIDFN